MPEQELGEKLRPLTKYDLQRVWGRGWYYTAKNEGLAFMEKRKFDGERTPAYHGIYVLPQIEDRPQFVGQACSLCAYKARALGGGCARGAWSCTPAYDESARAQHNLVGRGVRVKISDTTYDAETAAYVSKPRYVTGDAREINTHSPVWPDEVPLLCASVKLWAAALDPTLSGRLQQATYLRPDKAYREVTIPKANGKVRRLHVPCGPLMEVQSRILERTLNRCIWPEHVAAYVPGRQMIDTARKHAGKPLVITLDLKNFFGSTTYMMVHDALVETYGYAQLGVEPFRDGELAGCSTRAEREALLEDSEVDARPSVWKAATAAVLYLCDAVTCPVDLRKPPSPRVLPQGAPTSGAFANLVGVHRLDPRVLTVCAQWGFTYSRYADDLIFSRSEDLSREDTTKFIDQIVMAVFESGYRVNWDKLRVQRSHQQQRVLGLIVNDGTPRVPRKTRMLLRAQHHYAQKHGLPAAALRNLPDGAVPEGKDPSEVFRHQHEGRTAYVQYVHADNARGVLNLTPSEWFAQH